MSRPGLRTGVIFSFWLFLSICCLTTPAPATTLMEGNFTCALCGQKFAEQIVGSSSIGGRDSEFRPEYLGMPPLAYFVHSCPSCRFTDYNHRITLTEGEKEKLRAFLQEYAQQHDGQKLRPSQKYEIVAHSLEIRGLPSLQLGDTYIKAAWMADDEGEQKAAQEYRRQAIRHISQSLAGQEVEEKIRPNLTYLVGELNRRTGRFSEALEWFDRVQAPQPWLAALVKQQRDLASRRQSGRASLPPKER